jgi:hypothetical protein
MLPDLQGNCSQQHGTQFSGLRMMGVTDQSDQLCPGRWQPQHAVTTMQSTQSLVTNCSTRPPNLGEEREPFVAHQHTNASSAKRGTNLTVSRP